MDLSTEYLGLTLRNPLVASASPLSQTVDGVRRLADAGVGAVVLYSLFEEQLRQQAALDAELAEGFRWIEVAPPGSAVSVAIVAASGALRAGVDTGIRFVTTDAAAQHASMTGAGVDVGELLRWPGVPAMFEFRDPDGNEWLLQEVTTRFPGRIDSNATSFASVSDLASAMRRASAAHGEHEARMGGQRDENWPDWYAAYMVAEQAGKELPL